MTRIALLFLVVAIGSVGLVRNVIGRRDPATGELLEGDARDIVIRSLRLVLLTVAVTLVAEGAASLVAAAFPGPGTMVRNSRRLAEALAYTTVGVPTLAALAWWTRRRLVSGADERYSHIWAAYLGGMQTVALLVVVINGFRLLEDLADSEPADRLQLTQFATWSLVLAGHWVLNRARPQVDEHRQPRPRAAVDVLVGSGIGLVAAGLGVGYLAQASLAVVQEWVLGPEYLVVEPGPTVLTKSVAWAVFGLGVWIWFWWLHGLGSPRGSRWYGYALLVGVVGGLAVTLISAGLTVNSVLVWFFGDPGVSTAVQHFQDLPGVLAALIVGTGVLIHHRLELATGKDRSRSEVDRIYDYLLAFAGLAVSTVAVSLVIATFIDAVTRPGLVDRGIANPVITAVTYLLIGLPLWWSHWQAADRHLTDDPPVEVTSNSRRVYVIGALGFAAAVALISAVVMLTSFYDGLAGGDPASQILRTIRTPIGLLFSTAVVAVYHGLVVRDDRQLVVELPASGPPPPKSSHRPDPMGRPAPTELVMVSDLPPRQAEALARRLVGGATNANVPGSVVVPAVTQLRTGDHGTVPDDDSVEVAVRAMASTGSARVLVIVDRGAITVQPLIDESVAP